MESHSSWQGNVEVATIVHEGREFTNLGAVIGPDLICGYLRPINVPLSAMDQRGAYGLTTWDGTFMYIVVRTTRRWRQRIGNAVCNFEQFEAMIDGKVWRGRSAVGGDSGNLLRLRPTKKVAS